MTTDAPLPAPDGGLLDPHSFRRRFWKPVAGSTNPHQLRHLQASLLIANGRPLTEVAARLGHRSISVTGAIYAH
ncbi:MAG: tyrosine-type recombinase/integrase [Acidimicrobiia bacterium]